MSAAAEAGIRPLAAGDERRIAALETSSGEHAMEHWLWRHPRRRDGRRVVVAEGAGRLLAAASAVDLPLRLAGRARSAARVRVVAAAGADEDTVRATVAGLLERLREDSDCGLALWPCSAAGVPAPARPAGARPLVRSGSRMWRRAAAAGHTVRSLAVRAELVPDWEPRLDELAAALAGQYPDAVVRDAEYALRRWAGHPSRRWHRFLLLPRFSVRPVGWIALGLVDGVCRWDDLLWDHGHPAALEAACRLSARLARQVGAEVEEVWIAGDDETRARLEEMGFVGESLAYGLEGLALGSDVELDGAFYATAADLDDP